MKVPRVRSGWVAASAATLLLLGACERRDAAPAPSSAPAPSPAPAGSDPHAAIQPQSHELPASAGRSPADGATAIGGVAGNQNNTPPPTGAAPAPTAGDGAASASK